MKNIRRGAPLGDPDWVRRAAAKLKLESTERHVATHQSSDGYTISPRDWAAVSS